VAESDFRSRIYSWPGFPPWLSIGAEFTQAGFPNPQRTLAARVDDFAVWTRSLSEIEIEAVYRGGLSGRDVSQIPAVLDFQVSISASAGSMVISWPIELTGYVLQGTPSLTHPMWTPVPDVVSNRVTLANPAGTAFFRLVEP